MGIGNSRRGTKSGMSYKKASAGSGRGISASQWNGLLGMHKDAYAGNAGSSPFSSSPMGSSVVNVKLANPEDTPEDTVSDIAPFQPCVLIFQDPVLKSESPTYSAISVKDINTWGDYWNSWSFGFTMGEGVVAGKGGRVVVSGLARVDIPRWQLLDNDWDKDYKVSGIKGYCWYTMNNGSIQGLSTDPDWKGQTVPASASQRFNYLGPVGHYKVVSDLTWERSSEVEQRYPNEDDKVPILVDMQSIGTKNFLVNTTTTVQGRDRLAVVGFPREYNIGWGTPMLFDVSDTVEGLPRYANGLGIEEEANIGQPAPEYDGTRLGEDAEYYPEGAEATYGVPIKITNLSECPVIAGTHMVTWSSYMNCFVFAAGTESKTLLGKATTAHTVGATEPVAIWVDGVDQQFELDATLGWMAGTTDVSSGKEVMIQWFNTRDQWVITGAECEDA